MPERTKESTPPRRALVPGENSGERGSQEGKTKGEGAGPPPADKCHATCSHTARKVHAPEERTTRTNPPCPPPPPIAAPPQKKANQHSAARPPQRVLGRGRGRQGGCNEGQGKWKGGHKGKHSDGFPWGAWPRDAAVDTRKQAGRQITALTGASSHSCHVTKRFKILAPLQRGNKSMYSNTSRYVHLGSRLDRGKGITEQ